MASGYGQHPFHAPFNPLQDNHLNDLLTHAVARGAEFILCVSIGDCSDTDALWRDTGLDDGFGNGRPAYTRWVGGGVAIGISVWLYTAAGRSLLSTPIGGGL